MNRFIGSIVLCCAVAIGFSSISGCPKAKPTSTPSTPPAVAKLTLTAPATFEIPADKDKDLSFEVKIARENMKTPDVKIEITGAPKGVTLTADPETIAKDKDSTTIKVAIDRAKLEKGGDVTIKGNGDASGEVKVSIKVVPKGEEPKGSLELVDLKKDVEVKIADEKGSIEVKVKRINYTGEIKVGAKSDNKDLKFKDATIAKDKDSATIEFTFDKAAKGAAVGSTDVTVWATGDKLEVKGTTKVKLK